MESRPADEDRLPDELVAAHVAAALAEDLGAAGDITSQAVVPEQRAAQATIFAKQSGVLAGLPLARAVFETLDPSCEFRSELADGQAFDVGQSVASIAGSARAVLAGERTALNYLQRLSGIASATRAYVEAVAGTGAAILETRKTTPGWRVLEKHAVRAGGGTNHRMGLFDQVMLKENHFALAEAGSDAPGYEATVALAVAKTHGPPVIAEVRSRDEALAALRGGAGVLLLDNLGVDVLADLVPELRTRAEELGRSLELEASGGITLGTVRSFAEVGVDRISVGALTHSVMPIDLSLLVETGAGDR